MPNPFKNDNRLRRRKTLRQIKLILIVIAIGASILLLALSSSNIRSRGTTISSNSSGGGGGGGGNDPPLDLSSLFTVTTKGDKDGSTSTTSTTTSSSSNEDDEETNNWCTKIKTERQDLHPDLHITYPCEHLNNHKNYKYKSAIVTFLTAGVEEGKGSRIVFTGKEYINGALALGASLTKHLTRNDTLRLLLIRDGFTLPQNEQRQLEAVGWIIGKAPLVDIDQKYTPRFARYKTTYTKIAALGLSEFDCVLLMDADTLVIDSIDDLLSCHVFHNKNHTKEEEEEEENEEECHVAGTLDYYHKKWFHFNTGSILWNTNVDEMNRVYALTKDESFMKRFQSDQIFLNEVYPDRTNVEHNLKLLEEGPEDMTNRHLWGNVVNLGWAYNAQTHVEVQLPEFWNKYKDNMKIIHYTEKKGWQCPERHGEVLSEEEMKELKNCEKKDRDDLCFCSVGSLWWDALREGEKIAQASRN